MMEKITRAQVITAIAIAITAACMGVFLAGCTFYGSVGKQIDADEIIIRKYQSKPDLSPELIKLIEGLIVGEDPAEMIAGASAEFNAYDLSKWSKAVRERDNNVCFMCGKQFNGPGELEAHHILPKAEYPDIHLELWNGITLCRICHDKVHGKADNWIKYVPIFYNYTMQYEKDGVLP